MNETCCNCGGDGEVTVCIPCPICKAHGVNELDALRSLANWVERNFAKRSRPPKDGEVLLAIVRRSQGKE